MRRGFSRFLSKNTPTTTTSVNTTFVVSCARNTPCFPSRHYFPKTTTQYRCASTGMEQESLSDTAKMKLTAVSVGMLIVGGGIVVINVNERRAAKQHLLNEFCEKKLVSLTEQKGGTVSDEVKINTLEDLEGKVLHVSGEVVSTQPWAADTALGVDVPHKLRLRRDVAMYQWEEHIKEDKEKKTKEYTYSKKWAGHALHTEDGRNPQFPHYASLRKCDSIHMLFQKLKLKLSENFVHRLTDFHSCEVNLLDSSATSYGLVFSADKKGFYSKNGNPADPQIGDIRVRYEAVEPGMHTVLGKLHEAEGFVPYTAKLTKSLVSEGEIQIPEDAHKLSEKAGQGSVLTIPDWVAELAEDLVLAVAPLEFAFVERGEHSKKRTIKDFHKGCDESTNSVLAIGAACCVLGSILALQPAAFVVGGNLTSGAGLATGLGIAYKTQEAAKAQVKGMKQIAPVETADGDADVKM